MADITLSDGRKITIDLSEITVGQYLGIFDSKESDERTDKTVARVCGLEIKELKKIKLMDYKRILDKIVEKAKEPLKDPNSPSEST